MSEKCPDCNKEFKQLKRHKCKTKNKTTGLKRDTIDKFYTNNNIVDLCFEYILTNLEINKENDLIVEPSAGNGAFISKIKENCNNYQFYDIKPEHNEIIKQDFIESNFNINVKLYNSIHIIGNPPFGRQSSTTIKFIKKITEYANSISFILPLSFKKESLKSHFPLNYHLIFEKDLPKNSFSIDDKSHDVPCVFQIWCKKNYERIKIEKIEPINYKFVNKTENPDISFRRVGVNAGKIDKEIENKSTQSHYFIKFENNIKLDSLEKIEFTDKDNTVGPKSISKQELINEFNKLTI